MRNPIRAALLSAIILALIPSHAKAADEEARAIFTCMEALQDISKNGQQSVNPSYLQTTIGPDIDWDYHLTSYVAYKKGDTIYVYGEGGTSCSYAPSKNKEQLLLPCGCSKPKENPKEFCENCCVSCISYDNGLFAGKQCAPLRPGEKVEQGVAPVKRDIGPEFLEQAFREQLNQKSAPAWMSAVSRLKQCVTTFTNVESCKKLVQNARAACNHVRTIKYNGKFFANDIDLIFKKLDAQIALYEKAPPSAYDPALTPNDPAHLHK